MKVLDRNGKEVDKYRFQAGSLFEYDANANAYIHVYKHYKHTTKKSAIKAYEEVG